jgi:hypothetical protein
MPSPKSPFIARLRGGMSLPIRLSNEAQSTRGFIHWLIERYADPTFLPPNYSTPVLLVFLDENELIWNIDGLRDFEGGSRKGYAANCAFNSSTAKSYCSIFYVRDVTSFNHNINRSVHLVSARLLNDRNRDIRFDNPEA